MTNLSAAEGFWLQGIADGRWSDIDQDSLDRLLAGDLVRVIDAADAADVQRHGRLRQEVEGLRAEARETERPGGPRRLALLLARGARAAAGRKARELRNRADEIEREAKEQWLGLSQRGLVSVDLALHTAAPDGSYLSITEQGRAALRRMLHSEEFEREQVRLGRIPKRAALFLELRGELEAAGFKADPRIDLAAAMLSRGDESTDRLREINHLATLARWQSYDRFPIFASLCQSDGEAEELWHRFSADYDRVRDAGYPGTYETRLAVAGLMRRGEVDEEALERLREVLKRLRYDGWSMGQSTDPVAARLTDLRLSPTQIAARVQRLFDELQRGPSTVGPFLGLAASVAANSNLHPLTAKAGTAGVMEQGSLFDEFGQRYDELLSRMPGEGSARTLPAAILALMPGTAEGNCRRLRATAEAIREDIEPPDLMPLALVLMDAAFGEWFDSTRFVWELGSLMTPGDELSAFGAYRRTGAVFGKAGGGPEKPDGLGVRM